MPMQISQYRATNTDTQEVVEYAAELPYPEHMLPPWRVDQVFEASPSPDDPPPSYDGPRKITKFAFRSRFTQAEKVTIEFASLDDPAAPMQQRGMSAALRANQADIAVAQFVDLTLSATREGVLALEAVGLLAAGRAAGILDTPPSTEEVWYGN